MKCVKFLLALVAMASLLASCGDDSSDAATCTRQEVELGEILVPNEGYDYAASLIADTVLLHNRLVDKGGDGEVYLSLVLQGLKLLDRDPLSELNNSALVRPHDIMCMIDPEAETPEFHLNERGSSIKALQAQLENALRS